ncbi:hypothetical protein [Escherichia phage vB_EcoP_LHP]
MSNIQDRLAARAAAAVDRVGSQNDVEKGVEGNKTFKLAPAGKQKARLVGYVEIGEHENRFDPSKGPALKFRLRFALFGKDCQEEDGTPITIDSKDNPVSKFERANAVKMFAAMCPKRDADHFIGLLGRVFWLEVVHNEGKAGADGKKKVYANIKPDSIRPGVKDLLDDDDNVIGVTDIACPDAPEDFYQIYEWAVPSKEDFDKLKPWDKKELRASVGFQGSALQQLVGDGEKPKEGEEGNGGAATNEPEGGDEPQQQVEQPTGIETSGDDLPAL